MKKNLDPAREAGKDTAYLMIFQALNYVPSLVTVPYLMYCLGAERFGYLGFSLAVCQFLMILAEFGFNLSASRRIALAREDMAEVRRIFSDALFCRLGLLAVSFILLLLLSLFDAYEPYRPVLLAKFASVAGEAFLFAFLFQGLGYIRWVGILNCAAKWIVLPLTFLLVTSPDDYLVAATLPGMAALVMDALMLVFALRKGWIGRPRFDFSRCAGLLRDSFPIFCSNAAVSVYLLVIVLALGYLASPEELGRYSAADKIMRAVIALCLLPAVQAFYPSVSRGFVSDPLRTRRTVKRLLLGEVLLMSAAAAAMYFAAPLLPELLGDSYRGAEDVIRMLSLAAIALSAGTVAGQLGLLAGGAPHCKRRFLTAYLAAACVAAVAAVILIPRFAAVGAALSVLAAEVVAAAILLASMASLRSQGLGARG